MSDHERRNRCVLRRDTLRPSSEYRKAAEAEAARGHAISAVLMHQLADEAEGYEQDP